MSAREVTVNGVTITISDPVTSATRPGLGWEEVRVGPHSTRAELGAGRDLANAAWRAVSNGADAAGAFVAAVFQVADDEYDAITRIHVAQGRCPDGCCGTGQDFGPEDCPADVWADYLALNLALQAVLDERYPRTA